MRLKALGMIQRQEHLVSYELKLRDLEKRFFMCEQLLQRQQQKAFFHRILTGDTKWIYDNPKRKKSWTKPSHTLTSMAKPNKHGSKLTLCIWWDQQGVIYYELFQSNETITGDQLQLMCLNHALKEKRPQYEQKHKK